MRFGTLISPDDNITHDEQSTEENYDRMLPSSEEMHSPVHLPDVPQIEEREDSVPYFPEKDQDQQSSGAERLSESVLMKSLVVTELA